jgi:2-polyprenyl-3-methyl-5-hydroxy-6-metoxy-1,4-benzoquinol methylase
MGTGIPSGDDLFAELPAGKALDLGCGTGDSSIYLAQHGWTVTGVDYVPTATRTFGRSARWPRRTRDC